MNIQMIKCLLGILMSVQVFCSCPSGWIEKDNSCFLFNKTMRTWMDANDKCQTEQHGAHLIYLEDSSSYFLHELASEFQRFFNSSLPIKFFLGATSSTSGWFWSNGANVQSVSLPNYDINETLFLVGEIDKDDDGYYTTFNGHDDTFEAMFICEISLECHNYTVLSDADRAKGYSSSGGVLKCDQSRFVKKWYRFTDAAGSAMPTKCVAKHHCGTHAPGWLSGSHPTQAQGMVTRKVCYHWNNNCCRWSNNIRVRNCGGFYVYELSRTPTCHLRYCGNGGEDSPSTSLSSTSSSSTPSSSPSSFLSSPLPETSLPSLSSNSSSSSPPSSPPTLSSSLTSSSPPSSAAFSLSSPSSSSTPLSSSLTSSSPPSSAAFSLSSPSSSSTPPLSSSSTTTFSSPPPLSASSSSSLLSSSSSPLPATSLPSLSSNSSSSSPTSSPPPLSSSLTSSSPPSSAASSSSSPSSSSTPPLSSSSSTTFSSPPPLSASSSSSLLSSSSSSTTTFSLSPSSPSSSLLSSSSLSTLSSLGVRQGLTALLHNESSSQYVMVANFMTNIEELDIKNSSSLNTSIAMMDSLCSVTPSKTITNDLLNASRQFEEFVLKFIEYHSSLSTFKVNTSKLVLQAKRLNVEDPDYEMTTADPNDHFTFVLPRENFNANGTTVLSIYYKNLDTLVSKVGQANENYELKSKIVSIAIKPKRQVLRENVIIVMKTEKTSNTKKKKMCVFWKFANKQNKVPGWSRDGCIVTKTTDHHVECSCNHLTHFAVLMQVKGQELPQDHVSILTILTNIGLAVSILGCFLTFLAYCLFTDVKSEQSQIRMNLVLSLGIAHVLFLLGSPATFHITFCVTVAALLQFFYTSALCWMLAEGIQLYLQVVKVFNSHLKMRQIYGFAWGFPTLLIICSLSIAGNNADGLASFANEDFCWLSVRNHLVWTFVGPVLLVILANLVILGMVIKEMVSINKHIGPSRDTSALRSSVKAFVVLAPLLGSTWLFGLLSILGTGLIGAYIFTILNSLQGFLIFIFHCWRNSEIKRKFRRKIHALELESYSTTDESSRTTKAKQAFHRKGPALVMDQKTKQRADKTQDALTITDL